MYLYTAITVLCCLVPTILIGLPGQLHLYLFDVHKSISIIPTCFHDAVLAHALPTSLRMPADACKVPIV